MGKAWWKGREARGSALSWPAVNWSCPQSVAQCSVSVVQASRVLGVTMAASQYVELEGMSMSLLRILVLAFHAFPKVPWFPTSAFWGLCYKSDLFSWFFLLSTENLHLLSHYHSSFCFLLPKLWIFYFPVFSIFGVHLSKVNCLALFLIGF